MVERKRAVKKRAVAKKSAAAVSTPSTGSAPTYSSDDRLVEFRGALSGIDAVGSTLVFGTEHPEGRPTGVFRYDLAKGTLAATALDCGVVAQLLVGDTLWLGGTDGSLYRGAVGKKLAPQGSAFEQRIAALAGTNGGVAVVSGDTVHFVGTDGERASHSLGEPGRSAASDPTGAWVAVGTRRGNLIVFHDDGKGFAEVSRNRIHDGEVTALSFSPEELRVYSTGSDCRLLLSFVRGALDTEDRGGSNMHEREARAILIGPDFETADGTKQRFYTGGLDSTLKAWPRSRSGSQRPSSQGDGVVQTTALCIVEVDGKPHLAAAGNDDSIRVFALDEEGRVSDRVTTIRGAYARAAQMLDSSKPKDRESAFGDLASYGDGASLQQLSRHLSQSEGDHKLLVKGVGLLARFEHPHAPGHLEAFFGHDASEVRLAAFAGLRAVKGADDVDVLRTAADAGREDLGLEAVAAAAKIGNEEAIDLIRAGLDHPQAAVRHAALGALEKHFGNAAEGTLAGLRSSEADLRRTAIVRLEQRKLLGTPLVDATLRRLWEDDDDRARLWAFIVATHRRPNLVKALRAVDGDYHRQVWELETFGNDKPGKLPAAKPFDAAKLDEADFRPLLEAMGSRSIDVCLRGARGLAALGDERAFGTLLQLSREPDAASRVAVCRALGVLGDPRSIKRVRAMLHDPSEDVRGAAFSALEQLTPDAPLDTARAGLSASVDVRERALALLVKTLRKAKGKVAGAARALLLQALNDADSTLRQEAFKSALNLAVDGGGADTLRFIMESAHANVRGEALQEAKAHPKDAAFREVVLAFLDDPDDSNRRDAFEFALDRWPSKEHGALFAAGLGSRHVPQRLHAVEKLAERKDDLRGMLVDALSDAAREVRLAGVRALVHAGDIAMLRKALSSPHLDVRVEVARALATLGEQAALAPLHEVVDQYLDLVGGKAHEDELAAQRELLQVALTGMSALGDPSSIDRLLPLLEGDEAVAQGAASVLPAIADPSNLDRVRPLMQHDNESVRGFAALGLAYAGDASGAPLVFGQLALPYQLFAALTLREDSPERFLSFADAEDAMVSRVAFALTLALELSEHTAEGIPHRCLALLSAREAWVRLSAAEAVENYGDQPRFYAWAYAALNGLKAEPDAWQAAPATLLALSRAVAFGEPRLAIAAAAALAQLLEAKSDEFDRQWAILQHRWGDRIAELEKLANKRKASPVSEQISAAWKRLKAKAKKVLSVEPQSFDEALRALSFGAYVGLARQQHAHNPHLIRAAAITALTRLAGADDRLREDAMSVMLLALADPNAVVRERAFDCLRELGAPTDVLSTEALSTGLSDMGFRGLELLAGGAGGDGLLEKTLLESTNGLEQEAAKLLAERKSWDAVHTMGLRAASESFRTTSIRGLAKRYSVTAEAADGLRGALKSRREGVRFDAARELASKRDAAAFEVLAEMLLRNDDKQAQAVSGFQSLGDARAADLMLSRVEDDPAGTADVDRLLEGAASFRDAGIIDRLLALIDGDRHRSEAFDAAMELTGFDQYEWMNDDDVTAAWLKTLRPTHADAFADLFDLAYRIADTEMLSTMVGLAKWPDPSEAIDRTLGALMGFSQEHVRHRAVEIAGWRARNRGGPVEQLKQMVSSRDPLDQFYAAEGLALSGHDDGLAVLRTAVDAMDAWDLRSRAVLAIGRLADPSTLDMLLSLANDDAHALQEHAAEAIGHMSATDRADEVFATLKRFALGSDYSNSLAGLRGLRWFGTPGAWDLLRQRAKDEDSWYIANEAVQLLRHDPDSKDVVAEVLRENDDWDVAESAAASLRHLWGPDSLEPDYILMESCVGGLDEHEKALERLRERGDVGRILQALARVHEDNEDELVPPLVAILLSREPLPLDAAAQMLDSPLTRTATVAAQIVGRGGPAAGKKHGKALAQATASVRKEWLAAWDDFVAGRRGARDKLGDVGARYRRLVWATGQLQVAKDELVAAAKLPDHEMALGIREDAVSTLGEPWVGKDGVTALVELARGTDARLRSMAAAELDRCAPGESAKLLADAVHDDVSFGRLLNSLAPDAAKQSLRSAVDDAAGVALPRLAALGDVEGLVAAMRNGGLDEATRRGAIDALAKIATDDVAGVLASFGADEEHDEMLRKAAWRARRRVTRAVARKEAP